MQVPGDPLPLGYRRQPLDLRIGAQEALVRAVPLDVEDARRSDDRSEEQRGGERDQPPRHRDRRDHDHQPNDSDENGDHLHGPAGGVQATGHGRRVDHEHAGPAVEQGTRQRQRAEGSDEDEGLPVAASPESSGVDRQEESDQHRDD